MIKGMYLNVLCLLILITQTSFAKSSPAIFPVASTDHGEVYLTFTDLQQLKILLLSIAVSALIGVVKWFIGLFTRTEFKTREAMDKRLLKLEENDAEILDKLKELSIHFSHVKDSQVRADQIRAIARDEIEYVSKLQSKGK